MCTTRASLASSEGCMRTGPSGSHRRLPLTSMPMPGTSTSTSSSPASTNSAPLSTRQQSSGAR